MRNGHRSKTGVLVALSVLAALAPPITGQQATAPKPQGAMSASPPHEQMEFFRGTWVLEPGGIPASIGRQAGRLETCDWLPGARRHMVCRTSRNNPDGTKAESMYILSYRAADSTYVAYFAFPGGDNLLYHGTLDGDRWIMTMQPSAMLPPNQRFRTIITPLENGMRFVEEGSKDGGPWLVGEDYRYRRLEAPGADASDRSR